MCAEYEQCVNISDISMLNERFRDCCDYNPDHFIRTLDLEVDSIRRRNLTVELLKAYFPTELSKLCVSYLDAV